MAPYGINSFNEMIIPSIYAPVLSKMNLSSPLYSRNSSSELMSILSEHDYSMRLQVPDNGQNVSSSPEYCDSVEADNSCSRADVMMSCSDVDFHKVAASSEDTDFLMDLGELDFDLGELDPCTDEEMKDSFQEFIDSALEESSFLCESNSQQHDDDVALKENFLASLDLIPAHENIRTDKVESVSLTPVSSLSSTDTSTCSVSEDTSTFKIIPTKTCSCLDYATVPKVVYSTCHTNLQDSVHICPSSVFTLNNECSNCKTRKQMLERFMSPLFIDTSLTSISEPLPPLSDSNHHHHVAIDNSQLSEVDKDTSDIMKWLTENNYNDYNNNQNDISALTETPSQEKVNLENFVDLEDFLDNTDDDNVGYNCFDECYQRIASESNLGVNDDVYHSQLKLSFLKLPERSWANTELMLDSDIYCEGLTQDSLTPKSTPFSQCVSPSWSVTGSTNSSPLGSINLSSSSPWEHVLDDSSLKSQLALLKLFSEENAESLLVTDSPLQKERFV